MRPKNFGPRPGPKPNKDRRPQPAKNRGKAEKSPAPSPPSRPERAGSGAQWLYGLHAVQAALANPRRKLGRAVLTPRAQETLGSQLLARVRVETLDPGSIDRLLPP